MALQIRRGSSTQYASAGLLAPGELVFVTDTKKLYIGGYTDQGARANIDLLANMSGAVTSVNTQEGAVVLTTDDIAEGTTQAARKYFTDAKAVTAVATELVANNGLHSGVSFAWTSDNLIATATAPTITVVSDVDPHLGGNLVLNNHNITGVGSVNITGGVTITGNVSGAVNVTASGAVSAGSVSTNTVKSTGELELQSIVGSPLTLLGSRGTIASPTATLASDQIAGVVMKGRTSSGTAIGSAIVTAWASNANLSNQLPNATVNFIVGNNSDTPAVAASLDNGGLRVEGFMKVKNVAGTLPSPAEAGMIVLDGTTFKGYNGSAWVNLN
jgi:hypothetical protein